MDNRPDYISTLRNEPEDAQKRIKRRFEDSRRWYVDDYNDNEGAEYFPSLRQFVQYDEA